MLNVCLTFDYEIFFGENYGTSEEILFEPTDKLLDLLDDNKVKATFFADTCSVDQSRLYDDLSYIQRFEEQLIDMTKRGQDVQLHIHPHWLRSEKKDGKWTFDKGSYRIHGFGFDRSVSGNAYEIIKKGKVYLDELLSFDGSYKCIAYRAGGFAIQPHGELVKALHDAGIRVDSSIAPMLYATKADQGYDYRHRLSKVNWNISPDEAWYDDSKTGLIYEVPIATENKRPIQFVIRRILKPQSIKLDLGTPKGTYIGDGRKMSLIKRMFSGCRYLAGYNSLSMDAYPYEFLFEMLDRFYVRHNCDKTDGSVALIGHPKLINKEYLDNLSRFIYIIKKDNRFKMVTVKEAYENG